MRLLAGLTFAALLAGALLGQTGASLSTTPPPGFEIADVRVSAPSTNPNIRRFGPSDGRYELRDFTMLDLIAEAYDMNGEKVLGGPNWLELDRFDVIAKAPKDATRETAKLMLQALLADRFKLAVHMDNRPVPGFVLTVGKGKPKMKESDGSGNSGCQGVPQTPAPGTVPYAVASCHNMTMAAFAENLRYMAGAYIDKPVLDSTGLKGSWDFEIKWTARALLGRAGGDGITIYDAVDKQLGLKLEAQDVPASVIVVDSVHEKPLANPTDVTKLLPPVAPSQFEVADVKLSSPDQKRMGMIRNGRLDLQGFSLKELIRIAWDINSDEMIANEPNGLDSVHITIAAKASTSGPAPPVDFEDTRVMLRALLVDRFKLATHMEDRPVTAYTLVADKPKLTKADPANRTSCREGLPAGAKGKDPRDANPTLARLLTCQNITLAQFAQQLPNLASGYIHSAVIDGTGIEGAWDFTLNFSPIGLLQSAGIRVPEGPTAGPGQAAGAGPAASDPSGALSLFDAVKKQLGLRLDAQKRTLPVLVIDHVEQNPTDN
jgi:uncharacterized protein (TIGR03435 family)